MKGQNKIGWTGCTASVHMGFLLVDIERNNALTFIRQAINIHDFYSLVTSHTNISNKQLLDCVKETTHKSLNADIYSHVQTDNEHCSGQ